MALIRRLERVQLGTEAQHTEAERTYSILTDEQGRRLLQLDTYGSRNRKIVGKKSQSIRFSVEALEQLRAILREL